jgi:phage FluMu protein Com
MTEQRPPQQDPTPIRFRCERCGQLLARVVLAPGSVIEIKCKCNHVNKVAA